MDLKHPINSLFKILTMAHSYVFEFYEENSNRVLVNYCEFDNRHRVLENCFQKE